MYADIPPDDDNGNNTNSDVPINPENDVDAGVDEDQDGQDCVDDNDYEPDNESETSDGNNEDTSNEDSDQDDDDAEDASKEDNDQNDDNNTSNTQDNHNIDETPGVVIPGVHIPTPGVNIETHHAIVLQIDCNMNSNESNMTPEYAYKAT